jgi:twitching motility protein PilT
MLVTPAIANLIREAKAAQIYSSIQTGGKLGMQTMEQALSGLVKTGTISLEEGLAKSAKPDELKRLLGDAALEGNTAATGKRK